jgi:hypothetical protein
MPKYMKREAAFASANVSNREVAAQLFLSPRTIDFHLRNVFGKRGLSSRTQLAGLDLGWAAENDDRMTSAVIRPVRA